MEDEHACWRCLAGEPAHCVVLVQADDARQVRCPHRYALAADRTHNARIVAGVEHSPHLGLFCRFCEDEGSPLLELEESGWRACLRCIEGMDRQLQPLNCMGQNCRRPHFVQLPHADGRAPRARRVCGDEQERCVLSDAWRGLVVCAPGHTFTEICAQLDPVRAVNLATCTAAQQSIAALLRRMSLEPSGDEWG